MTEEWLIRSDREKLKSAGIVLIWVVSAIVHQIIGLAGIPVLSAFLVFTLCSIAEGLNPAVPHYLASRLLTQIPGFPIQACLGFLMGLILGRYSQRRVILWVWVVPLILFCLVLLFPQIYGSSLFGPYYSPDDHHKSTLLERLSWSILFIPSASYALGAKLAKPRRVGERS
jgi:hypothetical protein